MRSGSGTPGQLSILRRTGAAARHGTSIMRSCSCREPGEGRCARSTLSYGTPTTWLTNPARPRRKPGRSRPGGSSSRRRWRATGRRGRGSPPWPTPWLGTASPRDLLHEVIDGVSMDVQPRRFATFDDLAGYCHHVASVVGLCCLHIWGYRSEGGKAEQLAESCGIALQLTNIIRDVRDDARNGRIYLPEEDLARFGVEPEELAAGGRPSDRVRALLDLRGRARLSLLRPGAASSRRSSPRWAGPCS